MTDKPIPGSYWVVPDRLLAGEYPASADGEAATRAKLAAFLDAGFDAFFDLTRPGELPSYRETLEEMATARGLAVEYRRSGILDKGLPTPEQMSALLEAIDAALEAGRKVYLHCLGGIGRTGTTVGCWLARHGLTGEAALARLNELYRASEQSGYFPRSPEKSEQAAFIRGWNGIK